MGLDEERAAYYKMFGGLEKRVDAHAGKLENLETVPGLLKEIRDTLKSQDRRLQQLEREVKDNTAKTQDALTVTRDVRNAQIAGRIAYRVLKTVAAIIVACGVILGAVTLATNPGAFPGAAPPR